MSLFLGFATDACDQPGSLAAHVDGCALASPSFVVTFDFEDSTMTLSESVFFTLECISFWFAGLKAIN